MTNSAEARMIAKLNKSTWKMVTKLTKQAKLTTSTEMRRLAKLNHRAEMNTSTGR